MLLGGVWPCPQVPLGRIGVWARGSFHTASLRSLQGQPPPADDMGYMQLSKQQEPAGAGPPVALERAVPLLVTQVYQAALERDTTYAATLSRSLALVLDEFYQCVREGGQRWPAPAKWGHVCM